VEYTYIERLYAVSFKEKNQIGEHAYCRGLPGSGLPIQSGEYYEASAVFKSIRSQTAVRNKQGK
jgi:hypothetical protein